MSEFGTNVGAQLLELKRQRDEKSQAAVAPGQTDPAQTQQQRSQDIDSQVNTASSTVADPKSDTPVGTGDPAQAVPEPSKPSTTEPTNKDAASAEPTKPTEDQTIDIKEPEFDWGQTSASEPEPVKPTVDFQKLGSAFKLDGEVKSEDELVTKVTERFSQLSSVLDGVPDQLKQAIDIAKKGGNWMEFAGVSALDVSKVDPLNIFDREYARTEAARFVNPDGSFNQKGFDEELDAIPEGVKRMTGNRIKAELVANQTMRQNQIIAQATQRSEAFQRSLGEAASQLSALIPAETYGVTIEPGRSAYFYEGIANGSLIRKHLGGNIDLSVLSTLDAKKLIRTIAIAELGDKISKFRYDKGVVAGKKELLSGNQNAQITARTSPPRPDDPTAPVPLTSKQKLENFNKQQKPANSL